MIKALDLAFKRAIGLFGEGMGKSLNIGEEFLRPAPTELVNLQGTNHQLDFVYETKEGLLVILEFQSKAPTQDDYARFISYTCQLYRQKKIKVKIYIICVSELKKGPNITFNDYITFNPPVISFKDFNSEKIINTIRNKLDNNKKLSQKDLMNLIFAPLMVEKEHVEKQMVETIKIFSRLTPEHTSMSYKDLKDIGDIMGLFIGKYIEDDILQKELLGEIKMITGGFEKLMEEYRAKGREEGREEGIERGREEGIERGREEVFEAMTTARKLLCENYTVEEVMEKTGLSKKYVEAMK